MSKITGPSRFFAYARERQHTYLRRELGKSGPWTQDKIIQENRFTNVFRELDKTTLWFKKNVRDVWRNEPEVVLATVAFRMLNRIATGEAVFTQPDLIYGKGTAFEHYLKYGQVKVLRDAIVTYVGKKGPFVTGAYIISTPPGYKKLDGALHIIDTFNKKSGWRHWVDNDPVGNECTLEAAWEWLRETPYLGTFHSYEIVTDLRHTRWLDKAPDVYTWANIGPGARRGMNRIMDRPRPGVTGRGRWGQKYPTEQVLREMRSLLALSLDAMYWPQFTKSMGFGGLPRGAGMFCSPGDWPRWEMRDVEHTLCEFDKYERVLNGEGRPRGRFP
jgi:hypothetical protein